MAYKVGKDVHFEGYADDFDKAIRAIQFSLDRGRSWTTYPTEQAKAGRWVYWRFAFAPSSPGRYLLHVRSVNEDGTASPISASLEFEVAEADA